jgi:hypothetical protein
MDRVQHDRYLDYRERHAYFGRTSKALGFPEFAEADAEHRALSAKPRRDDGDDERLAELAKALFRD